MPWIKALLSELYGVKNLINASALRLIVIDGSTVQEPGATQTSYRLHIAIDLVAMRIVQVHVSTDKTGESLDLYSLQEGDVVIVDRGYNSPKVLVPFLDSGRELIMRYNPYGMNLYEFDEQKRRQRIQWKTKLQSLGKKSGCFTAYLCHAKQRIAVTLHAVRLSEQDASTARRNVRTRAKQCGRTPSAEALELCQWVLVISSLPTTLLSTESVGALYRVRWQIELVIKRMKSIVGIDKLRAFKDSVLAQLYLHGKLLWICVLERLIHRRYRQASRRMDEVRELSDWRLWKLMHEELKSQLTRRFAFREYWVMDTIKSLKERARKRQLQGLPPRVVEMIEWCRERGLSAV